MKPHSVSVMIVSESNGEVNQEVILKEYASTPEELVMKNFYIADAVINSLQAVTKEMASPFLQGSKPEKEEKKVEQLFVR